MQGGLQWPFGGGVIVKTGKHHGLRMSPGFMLLGCGLCLLGATTASAQWMDGKNLARVCDPGQQGHVFRPGMCSGYIMAAIDLDEALTARGIIAKPLFCMPVDVPISRVTAEVTTYIHKHPEKSDNSAATLVIDALGAAYPCKD